MESINLISEIVCKVCIIMNAFFLIRWAFSGDAKKAGFGWINLIMWPIIIFSGPLATTIIFNECRKHHLLGKVC